MFISEALAQTAPAAGPMADPMSHLLFYMLIMIVIFYFLVIRPQSTRAKQHRDMIEKVRRGDTVITAGGFIGRVIKAAENSDEVEVELSDAMKVRVLKSTLMDVRAKGEPLKDSST
jgi:preprotein translocase subunit YajC